MAHSFATTTIPPFPAARPVNRTRTGAPPSTSNAAGPRIVTSGRLWRTAPLWGIGLVPIVNGHENYLHDGRARGLAEAILWHGGEADRAKDRFRALPKAERDALIAFLKSL